MNVVSVVWFVHDEDANVCQRADVHEIDQVQSFSHGDQVPDEQLDRDHEQKFFTGQNNASFKTSKRDWRRGQQESRVGGMAKFNNWNGMEWNGSCDRG